MERREFLRRGALGVGAAWLGSRGLPARTAALPKLDRKFSATDTVTIGKTGIQTSRLAMGMGTVGSGHHSNQRLWELPGFPGCC
jgi:1-deoxyxylulose-5-phosphate synthase